MVCFIILSSCNNYLDIIPDNIATLEYAFRDRVRAEHYLYTCYSYMPKFGSGDDPGLAADEIYSNPQRSGNFPNRGFDIMYNGNNVTSPILNYWDGGLGGTSLWQGIRDCNIFLENIDLVRDLEDYDKVRWIAEVKFLKAYYHFYLLRLYGPIPIVRENMPISASPEEVMVYREPVDEVIEYIVELLDEATPDLPLIIENKITEIGRITQPIALSVKAKVLVTAASPLFNGNPDYVTFVDNRGKQLFNQAFDETKWSKAMEACKAAIDACHAAGMELYQFSNSSLSLTDSTRRVLQVSQVITDKWNNETIWGWGGTYQAGPSTGTRENSRFLEQFTIAPLSGDHRLFSGAGAWAPTLKMVELFYSNNGVPIEEDPAYGYSTRYDVTTVPEKDKYYMQPNYSTAKLHLNREARFYGSMGVDGGWWFGLGRFDEDAQWPIQSRSGQLSGRQGIERFSPTSLYIKKLHNYQSVYSQTTYIDKQWNFPIFRLADLYLLYAEALNETLDAPNEEVYRYVDLVRERAGLQSVAESWSKHSIYPQKYLNKDGMRDIIQRERGIELAFEGHRFYDIRRWKKAIQSFGQPMRGWNIAGEQPEEFYQPTVLKAAPYNPRDVFWPIKQGDISVNTNLVQNPGW